MSNYPQTLNLALMMPELEGLTTQPELETAVGGLLDVCYAKLDHYMERVKAITTAQTSMSEENAVDIHIALDHIEANYLLGRRLMEFHAQAGHTDQFSEETLDALQAQVLEGNQTIARKLVNFSNEVLVPLPEESKQALFAFAPTLERDYGSLFASDEPAPEAPASTSAPAVEEPPVSPDGPFTYQGIHFKHAVAADPQKAYILFNNVLEQGHAPEVMQEVVAEALTFQVLKENADIRRELGSDTVDVAAYMEKKQGIPHAFTRAVMDGKIGNAPVLDAVCPAMSWEDACDAIIAAYQDVHPEFGAIAEQALTGGWVQVGASYGTSSAAARPSILKTTDWTGAHPVILMNPSPFDDGEYPLDDIIALAHELGHVIHFEYLSKHSDYQPNPDSSIAFAETMSHIGEHLFTHFMLENVPDEGARMAIAANRVNRETGMIDPMVVNMRAAEAMVEGLQSRDTPYRFDEISEIYDRVNTTNFQFNWFHGNGAAFSRGAHNISGYIAAEAIARAFEERYSAADEQGRAELAERFISVLSDPETKRWEDIASNLGFNTATKAFAKKTAGYPQRLLNKTAEETGIPIPEAQTDECVENFRDTILAGRRAAAGGARGR